MNNNGVIYFGAKPMGHHFHGDPEIIKQCPWRPADIDARIVKNAVKDLLENQGKCVLVIKSDMFREWTLIQFWDRTGDSRGNSNSSFIAPGELTFEEVVARAKETFPELFKRFTFELTLIKEVKNAT